MTFCRCQVS